MTKARPPLSFERALTLIAGEIGWPAVATICGRNERTVRKWSESDVRVGIRMDAALALDVAYRTAGGQDAPMLGAYALRLETETVHALADLGQLVEVTAAAAKEGGEAIAALVAAIKPGASEVVREIAALEVEQAIGVLTRSLPMLRPAGGPKGSDTGPGGPS